MAPRARATTKASAPAPAKTPPAATAAPAKRAPRSKATTTETPQAARPPRARRSAGIKVDDDASRFGGAQDSAAASQPEQPQTAPTGSPAAPAPPQKNAWASEIGEATTAISVRMPKSLKQRLDGLYDYLKLTSLDDLPDLLKPVSNQTDIFNNALHRYLVQAEDEANNGKPFPVRLRR